MRSSRGFFLALIFLALLGSLLAASSGRTPHLADRDLTTGPATQSALFPAPPAHQRAGPNLAPGSNPSVLPADVLISDRTNNRLLIVSPSGQILWQFPRPGDLLPNQTFKVPDDAFFTPDGKQIVATEEDDYVISVIDVATHRIVWRYGKPGVPGSGANRVWNPDDAMMIPGGDLVLGDIKNCSLLIIRPPSHFPVERIGENTNNCVHAPPLRWGSPNGVFAIAHGQFLVTEINGDWVDAVTLGGRVLWSVHPPGVYYPSDSSQIGPNRYLTVDYSRPGQIVEFNRQGRTLWRYAPAHGSRELANPSLCMAIPHSVDLLCNDDLNDRVIVVDPRTKHIVWQYGHDGVAGTAPGYLHRPDGVDLVPPDSFIGRQLSTIGRPQAHSAAGTPAGSCTFGRRAAEPAS